MKRILLFLLPALFLMAGCDEMPDGDKPVISIDGEAVVNLQAEASEATFSFTAPAAWRVETDAKWFSLTPAEGGAGSARVTVKAEANTEKEARKALVRIICQGVEAEITVRQLGTEGVIEPPLFDGKPVKKLVVRNQDASGGMAMFVTFEYDASGRLSVVESWHEPADDVAKSKIAFQYATDRITVGMEFWDDAANRFEPGASLVADLDRQGRAIKAVYKEVVEEWEGGEQTVETNIILNYDGQGRLIKEIGMEEGYEDYTNTYIWDADNLVEAKEEDYYTEGDPFEYSEYENKSNIDLNWILSGGYTSFVSPLGWIGALGGRSKHYVQPDMWDSANEPSPGFGIEPPVRADWTQVDTYSTTHSEDENSTVDYVFDADGDLMKITVATPVYKTTYETKYWVEVLDYDHFEERDGVKYYWNVEIKRETKQIDRERLKDETEVVEVSY